MLDKIKERVLHEDFDGTSESSISIVTHMSAEQSRNYSKGRGSESTSRWVIKRRVLGYFRASDKELKLTQTKANTWSHIYTNAQQIAKPGWSIVKHTPNSMSFVRVENVRFDNQTVITDINLRNESGKITTNINYQKRQMPRGDIDSMEKTFHSESIEAKIKL